MNPLEFFNYTLGIIKGIYTDQILNTNLKSIFLQLLPINFKNKYIGGRGFALKLILDQAAEKTCYDKQPLLRSLPVPLQTMHLRNALVYLL